MRLTLVKWKTLLSIKYILPMSMIIKIEREVRKAQWNGVPFDLGDVNLEETRTPLLTLGLMSYFMPPFLSLFLNTPAGVSKKREDEGMLGNEMRAETEVKMNGWKIDN